MITAISNLALQRLCILVLVCVCVRACVRVSLFQSQGVVHILNLLPITLLRGWSHLLATTLHVENRSSLHRERARQTEYRFFLYVDVC